MSYSPEAKWFTLDVSLGKVGSLQAAGQWQEIPTTVNHKPRSQARIHVKVGYYVDRLPSREGLLLWLLPLSTHKGD